MLPTRHKEAETYSGHDVWTLTKIVRPSRNHSTYVVIDTQELSDFQSPRISDYDTSNSNEKSSRLLQNYEGMLRRSFADRNLGRQYTPL